MHIRSKFVMVGLSAAIFFTGGYIGHSYFTASDIIEENSVTIGSLVDEPEPEPKPEPDHDCNFDSDAKIDDKNPNRLNLKLNTPVIGQNNVKGVISYKGYDSLSGKSPIISKDNNSIYFDFETVLDINDIDDKFPSKDYIEIEIEFTNGDIVKYRIDFMRNNGKGKLMAHWAILDTKKEPIKKPEEMPPSQELPPKEEIPPIQEVPRTTEETPEPPETPTPPVDKPENKPEETPQPQPETPAPPVDEAPSEEPVVE